MRWTPSCRVVCCPIWMPCIDIGIDNTRRNNHITQSKLITWYPTSNTHHKNELRIKVMNNIVSQSLRCVISLLTTPCNSNGIRSLLRLDFAYQVGSPIRDLPSSCLKMPTHRCKFVLTNRHYS